MKKLFFIGAFLVTLQFSAQQITTNELSAAQKYYQQKDYKKAESILQKYVERNPSEIYGNWLYGQVAHDLGNKKLSQSLFLKALETEPNNETLRLDYARTLFYSGQLKDAEKELNIVINSNNNKELPAEALLLSSYIEYWNGNTKKASINLDLILKEDPNSKYAKEFKKDIETITSPYINLSFNYKDDEQPLHTFEEVLEIGVYKNRYFSPKIIITNNNFNTHKQVLFATIGNTFSFNKVGLSVSVSGGIYKHFSDNTEALGELLLKQKIAKHLTLQTGINRNPYLGTIASTQFALTENNAFGILEYENAKLFTANAQFSHKFYKGNNSINTIGAWILSKPFKFSTFEFKAGYGVSYSDSKHTTFTSEHDLESVASEYPLWSQIPGVYDPYFTPSEQTIHLIIGALNFSPTNKITLGVQGNYGFHAKTLNPILFLDQDATTGTYSYITAFNKTNYHPYDINAFVQFNISEKISLKAHYQHQKTYFYTQDNAGLSFHYIF